MYIPAVPFWNQKSEQLSKQIWNPSDFKEELTLNESLYSKETHHPEIINQKIPNTCSFEEKEIICSRKIRFYPTKKQKVYFQKCFSAHRYFYNKTVEEINRRYDKRKEEFSSNISCIFCQSDKEESSFTCSQHKNESLPWNITVRFNEMRSLIVKNNDIIEDTPDAWQAEIPHDTRQLAVHSAVSAYTSAMTNRKRGNIKNFRLGYMSKKKPTHIFNIDHRAIKIKKDKKSGELTVAVFSQKLGKNKFLFIKKKYNQQIENKILRDESPNKSEVKMLYDRGAWYLIFCIKEKTQNKCENLNSIALDPGVRTFQTGYSPNGSTYKFGERQLDQMKMIHFKIDKLNSIIGTPGSANRRKRLNIKRRLAKLEFRLRGIIHNLHNQVGSFLSRNYKHILLPEFETSGMQESRNIHSTTKRRMNGLAHYKFQIKMEHLCKKYGSELKLVNEAYTSKTCGSCGKIKEDLGSNCIYSCSNCEYTLDRDIHGARNIWIKTITLD
jgi:IS605 OrfB family transposase